MKGRKSEEDLKSSRIVIHVNAIEKEKASKLAKRKGMDVSTYIRTFCIYEEWDRLFGGDV